jgi:threonine/homoserine/homoserine lactone efflux protein
MIGLETAVAFMGFAVALALVPGPDNIFVLTQSALHGRLSGIFVTLGLATGLIFHTTAVAFGVAAIFETSQLAFSALKYIGAAYLIYLAYKSFREGKTTLDGQETPKEPASALYKRGLIMNIANPKVTIFFLAFLPQFVDPKVGSIVGQFYQLGGLMILMTILVFSSVALAAGFLGNWLRKSSKAMIWMNRASGMIFIALAAKLALAQK